MTDFHFRPDVIIRFTDMHPADSDFFRLDDCLMTPDDAREHLTGFCGFTPEEASDYMNSLEIIVNLEQK